MAYLIKLDLSCKESYCKVRASVEVFDRFNGSRGKFCSKHGQAKLKRLKQLEAGTA
tara:strand:+ start:497 stop:664 length:168 start_codon:yes stop_codon:yes gene_type:complete